MSSHSKFGPSGASRWTKCSASLLYYGVDDGGSEYANEGTAAHDLAEKCLKLEDEDGFPEASIFVGDEIDGCAVTHEMADAVQCYLDAIRKEITRLAEGGVVVSQRYEVRLLGGEIYGDSFGGTIDCLLETASEVVVVDFKYGAGVLIDAVDNLQLTCYLMLSTGEADVIRKAVIVQPRTWNFSDKVKAWYVPVDDYNNLAASIVEKIQLSRSEYIYKSGDHCQFCPGKAHCPELKEITLTASEAIVINNETALEVVAVKKRVNQAIKKLVRSYYNREWKDGYKVEADGKLLSPAQAEKLKHLTKEEIDGLTIRRVKGVKAVPESDLRPATGLAATKELYKTCNPKEFQDDN